MSTKDELVFNYVLLAFQVSLGIWQFIKITPVGALIKGTIGWLLRPLGLFPVYARLQSCRGRVFKKANCFVLQVGISSERLGILRDENNTINLHYLGNESVLERKGMDGNMLYRDGKMCYYITRRIWEELQTLGEVVSVGILESRTLASAATFAAAAAGRAAAERTAAYGIEEILDGVILYNQHVSLRLNDDWLLPINLSVSQEKLLKIINLLGLFLQTKTVKVHWLIQTSLSLISALMEFSTTIRVWIHTNINVVFCYVMHCICDPLPRWWRRQVYSLGKWVEKLKPCNDMQLKVVRGNMRAIISEGAKVDKEGITSIPLLNVADSIFIQKQFPCELIENDITCAYARDGRMTRICQISGRTIFIMQHSNKCCGGCSVDR